MMKIHTTQNLSLLSTNQPTNVMLIKDSKMDYLDSIQFRSMRMSKERDSVSFKGGAKPQIVKDIIEKVAKKGFLKKMMEYLIL